MTALAKPGSHLRARQDQVEQLLVEVAQVLRLLADPIERAEWLSIRTACLDEQRRLRRDVRLRGHQA